MFDRSDVKTILLHHTQTTSISLGFHHNFIIELKRAIYRVHMTNISFDFGQEHQVGLDPCYLSSKGSNCRGVAHVPTVPSEDPHGAGGGMIMPASLAIES